MSDSNANNLSAMPGNGAGALSAGARPRACAMARAGQRTQSAFSPPEAGHEADA